MKDIERDAQRQQMDFRSASILRIVRSAGRALCQKEAHKLLVEQQGERAGLLPWISQGFTGGALKVLEDRGYVTCEARMVQGKRAEFFQITGSGRHALDSMIECLDASDELFGGEIGMA